MAAVTGRELRIAVVGATGAVGEQIVELIDARALPCSAPLRNQSTACRSSCGTPRPLSYIRPS